MRALDQCSFSSSGTFERSPRTTTLGTSNYTGSIVIGDATHTLDVGDMFVIPSWASWSLQAESQFDLFRFSDAPIVERLGFARTHVHKEEG